MYAVQDLIRDNSPIEDSIDCPFNELALIRHFGKSYQFKMGAKANLPAQIIVATCLEYASWASQGRQTINIPSLLYDEGSPGMVFKLTESILCAAIETVAKEFDPIWQYPFRCGTTLYREGNSLNCPYQCTSLSREMLYALLSHTLKFKFDF